MPFHDSKPSLVSPIDNRRIKLQPQSLMLRIERGEQRIRRFFKGVKLFLRRSKRLLRSIGAFPLDSALIVWRDANFPLRASDAADAWRTVRARGFVTPIHYRRGTSDAIVLEQVFEDRQYAGLLGRDDVQFIVDCGANIGAASLLLLERYPAAQLIAVEPDAGNMAVCKKNLSAFGSRVRFVESGIWSSDVGLIVERGGYGDGRAWSFQVRPCRPGEMPEVRGVSLGSLMRDYDFPRIDLLKMDIERSELEVFSHGDLQWLPRTRVLAIELHDAQCRDAYRQALANIPHRSRERGEVTVTEFVTPVGS
jgi:FkbM family methyltransferase